MANDIDKTSPHYKGEFGSIYEVNQKFPSGGVEGDYVAIDGWAHYWNADRGTWCVNAQRDSYWDELITGIIEKFKLIKGATYMGVAGLDTVPAKVIGAKMYYFATVAGTYKNFCGLVVPQGINVLYSENGSSWVCYTLLEVAQELGVSTRNVVSQKVVNEALAKKANTADVDTKFTEEKKRVDAELAKKFDKENIAQEFGDSKDKVVSQFAIPFREIESPEFIKVIVDAEDHFLFGIQLDGSIEWGKGIPAPIRAKLREIINQCQQDKTDILEAINAAKKELSASIAALQEGKVDKEEGKSLIEDEVKECFTVIENEEFIMAVVDSEDRLLFGIYRATGKPYFPLNEMYHVEQNEEFFAVWLDAANHVLFGIRRDGEIIGEIHAVNALKQVISQLQYDFASLQEKVGTIDSNLKELLDVFSLQENTEYLAVEQDAEGKVLSATNPDGSHYIHKVKSETILTQIEEKTDIENRLEMTLDEEEHILSYRDKNGVKHETALGVEHLDVEHFSMKGESIDFSNYATQDDVNGIELKNIDGVYDNSKPNLYLTSQKTYTTADGKQSFTPPNAGAEMSNKIPCKPGEWFTRTGTATGMVVVSDKNDNNAKRLMPNGSLPKASVQVPEYWDWAAYIRFAVATYENNVTINRGKYAVSESSDSVSIPKLKLNVANFTKETKYLKSPNGTFFELSVSDKGVLSVKEIDKDLVAPFDVPSDLKFTISNPSEVLLFFAEMPIGYCCITRNICMRSRKLD